MSDDNEARLPENEEYVYANGYHYFLKALDNLCRDADAQCEVMGYFNVAWELRDDARSSGKAVLALASGRLSGGQKGAVSHLLASLDALPDSVVDVDNVKDEHLRAMRSPFWASVREEARHLRVSLEQETARVKLIVWPQQA
jgi:hypothetical protein